MSSYIILLAVGIGVASLIAFAVLSWDTGEEGVNAEERLDMLATRKSKLKTHSSLLLNTEFSGWESKLESLATKIPNLGDFIDQSGLSLTGAKLLALSFGSAVIGAVLTLFSPLPAYMVPVLGATFLILPATYVWFCRAKRLKAFGRQLPDALDLLGRSLKSGHSLPAGFNLIGTEMKQPLAEEFYRVFEEQNLGIPLEQALDQLANRVPNLDLRFFATAVILQRTTGGDLAEILEKISALIRARLKLQGTIAALTGEGRVSGTVLLAMAPALGVYMYFMNREYITLLFTDQMGRYMILGAVFMQVLGALAIKKIITIRV